MGTPPNEMIRDVRSVVEALSTDASPLYQVKSLWNYEIFADFDSQFQEGVTLLCHRYQILLSAFECTHCNERNNEVHFTGEIQDRGCNYQLDISLGDPKMLNWQLVKSESATIKIPELDFEIPLESQRGSLSTVEGILTRAVDELQALQEEQKKVDPKTAEAIDKFLLKLKACAAGDTPFTFILDDPAGNSYIENLFAPSVDPSLTIKFFERTPEQQALLGYLGDPSQMGAHNNVEQSIETNNITSQILREPRGSVGATAGCWAIAQLMTFPSTCGACAVKCETRMYVAKIPFFQEVIVIASSCDTCGYCNSEVKPGGAIPAKGKKVKVSVRNIKDLSRDVIKLTSGTLGGIVTTIEGLITKIHEIEEYLRSWDQIEELGLNDMDTSSADAAYNSTDAPQVEPVV